MSGRLYKLRSPFKWFLDGFGTLLVVASCLSVLYYWDPTRVLVKSWQEPDPYVFEAIDPALATFDPAEHITIRSREDMAVVRQSLLASIWGDNGLPYTRQPDSIRLDIQSDLNIDEGCRDAKIPITRRRLHCEAPGYRNWHNLQGLDDLSVRIDEEYIASIAYFRPLRGNGILVLYHHGYAGTYHDQFRIIEALVGGGYTVAALNHASYGDNACPNGVVEYCHVAWGGFEVPLPMRVHFTPPVVAVNYGLSQQDIRHVAMIGLSAGAWVTAVTAAVDRRIEASFPVAGVMPVALRRGNEWPKAQRYGPLAKAASFLDLYILATDMPSRRQMQIFNRYDRCCYSGLRPQLYSDALKSHVGQLEGGLFDVISDETHARHKISRHAFRIITSELQKLTDEE